MSEGWQEDLDASATADLDPAGAATDLDPAETAENLTGGTIRAQGGDPEVAVPTGASPEKADHFGGRSAQRFCPVRH